MSQLFSTDLIPIPDRLDAWLSNARQICGNCQFHFNKHYPFHGSIERRKVGNLEFTLFSSSALSFDKIPQGDLQPERRVYIVISQLAGVRQYSQAGKLTTLSKGDTTLIDAGVPWSSSCAGDCARLYLRVPRLLMERSLRSIQIPFATRISGASGLGATLFHLATSLHHHAEELSPEEGAAGIDAYLNVLSACLSASGPATRSDHNCAVLLDRIDQYIEDQLSETGLCPSKIAAALGISVRHLHRVFSRRGFTVADWIRAQRLKHCGKDLCDPRLRQKSITEIAFSWGFNDSAHFSHSFKQQFGVCPRDFRSRYWPPSAAELEYASAYLAPENLRRPTAG